MIPKHIHLTKRIFDLVLSTSAVTISLPIMVLIAALIYFESPGPVLYKQTRLGIRDRKFQMYKFRTMRLDAEKNGVVYPQENDPRVLRIGKILRNTRLDELPNFFNVILGDMSIVGPRAERPEIYNIVEPHIPEVKQRLMVKPGITGLAQIELRSDGSPAIGHHLLEKYPKEHFIGPLNIKYKLEYDKEYIDSLTTMGTYLKTDFSIMAKTPYVMFINKNTI